MLNQIYKSFLKLIILPNKKTPGLYNRGSYFVQGRKAVGLHYQTFNPMTSLIEVPQI